MVGIFTKRIWQPYTAFDSRITCEDNRLNKQNALINVQSMILLRVKYFLYPFAMFVDFFHSALPIF